jgi:hypothetical protein
VVNAVLIFALLGSDHSQNRGELNISRLYISSLNICMLLTQILHKMPLHDPSNSLDGSSQGGNYGSVGSSPYSSHDHHHPHGHLKNYDSGQYGPQHENCRQDVNANFVKCSNCLLSKKNSDLFATNAFQKCAKEQVEGTNALRDCLKDKIIPKLTAKKGFFRNGNKAEVCKNNEGCMQFLPPPTQSSMPVGILVSSIFVNRKNEYHNFL